jgi:hypothetical protein
MAIIKNGMLELYMSGVANPSMVVAKSVWILLAEPSTPGNCPTFSHRS